MYLNDYEKLKKFQERTLKFERSVPLDGGIYNKKCEREIFVKRACKFYLGKKYWIYNGGVRKPIYISGIRLALSYSLFELEIYYLDFTDLSEIKRKVVKFNDLYKFEGIEMPNGFGEIETMFLINEPEKTFTFNGSHLLKKRTIKKGTLIIKSKSIELAQNEVRRYIEDNKENPDRLIISDLGDYKIS